MSLPAGDHAAAVVKPGKDLYRGVVVWNKTKKRNTWGLERHSIKASADWISVEAPHLRIVSGALWLAALIVRSRSHGSERANFYACSSFHHRGKTVCSNSLEMRLEEADEAIVSALGDELLDEDISRPQPLAPWRA